MLRNASNFPRWYDTLDRWPFLLPFDGIGGTHICEQVDVLVGSEPVNLHKSYPPNLLQLLDQGLLLQGDCSKFISRTIPLLPC
jgi:hypothetical protein